ncbi:MAG: choice-of-anchor M domain-containing protein [Pirellulales bacterium]|nr:choice-of-anchor M domain-containing protein [Pirellulales bacterium]
MNPYRMITCSTTAIVALATLLAATVFSRTVYAESIYSGGHGDIGAAYEIDEPNEFHLHLHAGAGAIVDGSPLIDEEEFHAEDVIIQVPTSSNIGRTAGVLGGSFEAYDFTGAGFNFLGTGVGDNLWVLMFDSADASYYGQPFMGLAAEEGFTPSQWSGSIQFQLSNFSGPGQLSVLSGAFSRRWDTFDNSFANDVINIGPGGHSHFYWAFTEPGTYQVEVTVQGTHNLHGLVTGTDTFTFHVVPEPGSLGLLGLGALGLVGFGARYRVRRGTR